jgi:hypothetical protein
MKDALTDEFYLSYWDYLKLIGIGSVLAIGVMYSALQVLNAL